MSKEAVSAASSEQSIEKELFRKAAQKEKIINFLPLAGLIGHHYFYSDYKRPVYWCSQPGFSNKSVFYYGHCNYRWFIFVFRRWFGYVYWSCYGFIGNGHCNAL